MTNGGTTGETANRADGGRTGKVVSTEPVREGPATDRMAPGSRIRTPVVRVAWVARVAPANSTRRRAVPPAPEAPAGRAVSAVPLAPGGPGDPGMGNGPGSDSGSSSDRDSGSDRSGSGSDQVPAVGDCVVRLAEAGERIDTLDFPVVVDCDDPGSYRVVATYDDPGPMQTEYEGAITPCVDAGASEATLVFQWGVADTYDSVEEYQRGICLVEAG